MLGGMLSFNDGEPFLQFSLIVDLFLQVRPQSSSFFHVPSSNLLRFKVWVCVEIWFSVWLRFGERLCMIAVQNDYAPDGGLSNKVGQAGLEPRVY